MDLLRLISPVHTPYIFFSCSLRTRFLPLSCPLLSHAAKEERCCLTKSHGRETTGAFSEVQWTRYSMSLISIHFFTLPPHPPYYPLHLASRFIVYFMIITLLNTRSHHISGLIPHSLLFRLSIASSNFPFMTRGTKTHF